MKAEVVTKYFRDTGSGTVAIELSHIDNFDAIRKVLLDAGFDIKSRDVSPKKIWVVPNE